MKPVVKLHETYQSFVIEQLQQHYAGGMLVLVNKDWPLITKLWIANLTDITTALCDLYCARGSAPRDPDSMLRSFLLFLLTKPEIGITAWVDELYRVRSMLSSNGDILISPTGVPICSAGLKMRPNGRDNLQNRRKWRCALACGTNISCATPCSKAKYGRTYNTHSKDNLLLFPKTLRDSEKWNLIYKRRTSIERSNKREKIDYKLEAGRHRSTKMWYIRIYGIMTCQHIDAWFSHRKKDFANLKTLIFTKTA